MHRSNRTQRFAIQILLTLSSLILFACVAGSTEKSNSSLAPISSLPPEVQKAPKAVQEAYRFAVANPEILKEIPCYCGCGAVGHTSNYACYIKDVDETGKLIYDAHALGCSICVDITRDVMRMTAEGKSLQEIRQVVDRTYSQYGPSNAPSIP